MSRRRVVVTGLGMISPLGTTAPECWSALLGGRAAVATTPDSWRRYAEPTSTVWAPLPPIDWAARGIGRIEQMQLDPCGMLAITAAAEALDDAGLAAEPADPRKHTFRLPHAPAERCGVFMGTGVGGISSFFGNVANHLLAPLRPGTDSRPAGAGPEPPGSATSGFSDTTGGNLTKHCGQNLNCDRIAPSKFPASARWAFSNTGSSSFFISAWSVSESRS